MNYSRKRNADRAHSDLKFAELKTCLQHDETAYKYFHNGHDEVWLETSFDIIYRLVMDSYLPRASNKRYSYHYVFYYRVVEDAHSIYFAIFNSTIVPEKFDWDSLMHHQQWIETPNPINERIEAYRQETRQRAKGASWWEFWRYSKFD